MEDPFGGMFKITGSNYSIWKSKMRDILVVKDPWMPVSLGGDAFEDNDVHPMLHRRELV